MEVQELHFHKGSSLLKVPIKELIAREAERERQEEVRLVEREIAEKAMREEQSSDDEG